MTWNIGDEERQHLARQVLACTTQITPASEGAIVAYRLGALIVSGDCYEEFDDDLECAAGAIPQMDAQQLAGFVHALIDILGLMAEQCEPEATLATLNRGYRDAGQGRPHNESRPRQGHRRPVGFLVERAARRTNASGDWRL
jgi:hypothetical protein